MFDLISLLAFENLTPANWDTLYPALMFLWQGLLAIFVVIGLIVLVVKITSTVISKVTEAKKNREAENTNDAENHS